MHAYPPIDLYPPDFIHPLMVEDTGNPVTKLPFPDGFIGYAPFQDEAEWIYDV